MDTIETHTITRTLRFRTNEGQGETVAWLKVTRGTEDIGTERIVGAFGLTYGGAATGSGWVAHADTNASVPLPDADEETWRNAVRLVHLYR